MVSPPFSSNFFTTSSGTRTHYLQSGDSNGTLIVCLHGLGGSVNTFTSLVKALPQTYNFVLADFQGFGKTALKTKTEPLSIYDHVTDLHDLVAFLQGDSNGTASGRKVCSGT
jgi:pimeloyl-ACP methyl ester carboxylesterase